MNEPELDQEDAILDDTGGRYAGPVGFDLETENDVGTCLVVAAGLVPLFALFAFFQTLLGARIWAALPFLIFTGGRAALWWKRYKEIANSDEPLHVPGLGTLFGDRKRRLVALSLFGLFVGVTLIEFGVKWLIEAAPVITVILPW